MHCTPDNELSGSALKISLSQSHFVPLLLLTMKYILNSDSVQRILVLYIQSLVSVRRIIYRDEIYYSLPGMERTC